jgi:hypothetical protein
MTRRIQLSQIGSFSQEKYEQLLRATVLRTDGRIKEKSPVDLGRFRLSWAIGENAAPFPGMPPGDYRGQPTPPRAVNYTLGNERAGNVYSIHNNLPYAEKLATAAGGSGEKEERRYNPTRDVKNWETPGRGGSIQAPAGWVDLIAREMTAWARQQADRIGRQD